MRRLALAAALVCGLVLTGHPVGAEEVATRDADVALAQQVLATPQLLTLLDDGGTCTGVPDQIPGIYDFTAACAAHDACYALGVDRLACDQVFRQAMLASCTALHPQLFDIRRYLCIGAAELYFLGVRLFGGFAFV